MQLLCCIPPFRRLPPCLHHKINALRLGTASRSSFAVGDRIGSSGWLAVNGWRASARKSLGGKSDSIPHSQWANRRCEDCSRIARQVGPAGAARNHLATSGPAPTDHSAAGSGGVGTPSRTTSRAKFANGCDGRFLAPPGRSHVLPLDAWSS